MYTSHHRWCPVASSRMTSCFSGPIVALLVVWMRRRVNGIGVSGWAAAIIAHPFGLTAACTVPARRAKWWLSPLAKPSSYWPRIHLAKSALPFPLLPMESCINAHRQGCSRWAEKIKSDWERSKSAMPTTFLYGIGTVFASIWIMNN